MAMGGDPSAGTGSLGFRVGLHEQGAEGVVRRDVGEQRCVGRDGVGCFAVDDEIDERSADLARVGLFPQLAELTVDGSDLDGKPG